MRHPVVSSPLSIPLQVTSPFGPRIHPITGAQSFHSGVDYRASEGTEVRAPFAGVAHTFASENGGNIVSIESPDGWTVNLDHLQAQAFTGPVSVDAGALVGFAGHTGRVTGPHLHVELRPPKKNGVRQDLVDPEPFFSSGGGAALFALVLFAASRVLS